jgi:orotate phosphoribosyltransferase
MHFADKALVAETTAKMLLEVKAVLFFQDKPFIFTSGWASPVYIDCRKLIFYPRIRTQLVDFAAGMLARDVGFEQFDVVAGGETAGIPYAAWIADRLNLPMQYVRKKPKGFGRNAQIEGDLRDGARTLLVEDLTTDGRSKINFVQALRTAGASVDHVFVNFYYDIFPESKKTLSDLNVRLHYLATWWDILSVVKKGGYLGAEQIAEVEAFLHAPAKWSAAHGGASSFPAAS